MWRGDEVLLIIRDKPPFAGAWSIPGGALEFGETLVDAAIREVREETGVTCEIVGRIDVVEAIAPDQDHHYVIFDYAARWISGEARPASDARDAAFVPFKEALQRFEWSETRRVVEESRRLIAAL